MDKNLEKAYLRTLAEIEWQIETAQKIQEGMMQNLSAKTFYDFFRWNADDLLKAGHNVSFWSEVLSDCEDAMHECGSALQKHIDSLLVGFQNGNFKFNSTSILTNVGNMFIAEADGENLKTLRAIHKRQIAAEA